MSTAREELHRVAVQEMDLLSATLLVFLNKQDVPHAMSASQCRDALGIDEIERSSKRKCLLQPCCAVSGDGLTAGLDWLADNIH